MNAPAKINRQAVELDDLADEKLRATALLAGHLCALDAASAATDHPTTLALVNHYRNKTKMRLRWIHESAYSASDALGMFGPNGFAPAIEDVCRAARHYGFDWMARREELLASCRPAQVARALGGR